jgi:hypothetical protein
MPPVAVFDYMEDEDKRLRRGRDLLRVRTYSGVMSDNEDTADNWSTNSAPSRNAAEDEVSELSSQPGGSSRTSLAARFRKYWNELENRADNKKAARVAEDRRRAAERLRPRELSSDNRARLLELKSAVEARRRAGSVDMRSAPYDAPNLSLSETLTDRLHAHGYLTRILVVMFLLKLLFTMLHYVKILGIHGVSTIPFAQDAVVVGYILLCSVVHFAVCDVALVYAFSSLDLGRKSGREVKLFYSANVRMAVAACSLLIVSVSVAMAAAKVWARSMIVMSARLVSVIHDSVLSWSNSSTSDALPASLWRARSITFWVIRECIDVAHSLLHRFWSILVRSNGIGRILEKTCLRIYGLLGSYLEPLLSQAHKRIEGLADGDRVSSTWREEAFDTAGFLFKYSAVFLVIILVTFHFSTRRFDNVMTGTDSRAAVSDDTERSMEDMKFPPSLLSTRTVKNASASFSHRPRASTSYDAIPENDVVNDSHLGVRSKDGSSSSGRRGFRPALPRLRSWTAPEARLLRKMETR